MKRIIIVLFLFAFVSTSTAMTPSGVNEWQIDSTTFRKQIGGSIQNYQKSNGTWAKIDNTLEYKNDSTLHNVTSVVNLTVGFNGLSTVTLIDEGVQHTVSQKLIGVAIINTSTLISHWIDSTMDWNNHTVLGSSIAWHDVSDGVSYRTRKKNGGAEHNIMFSPKFIANQLRLAIGYNIDNIALANVMEYTFSESIQGFDLGASDNKEFLNTVNGVFQMQKQEVHWTVGEDFTQAPIKVKQHWLVNNGKIWCIEYVMMNDIAKIHIENPTAYIWHNADTDIVSPDVEDCYIGEQTGYLDLSYGGATSMLVDGSGSGNDDLKILMRALDLNNELGTGYTVTYCTAYVYLAAVSVDGDVGVTQNYRHDWEHGTANGSVTEGVTVGATGRNWSNSTSEGWTIYGAYCEDPSGPDNGAENSHDGSGSGACSSHGSWNPKRDRGSVDEEIVTTSGAGTYGWDCTVMAQADENDTLNIQLDARNSGADLLFRSTEYSSNKPYFTFIYTAGAPPPSIINAVRNSDGSGVVRSSDGSTVLRQE